MWHLLHYHFRLFILWLTGQNLLNYVLTLVANDGLQCEEHLAHLTTYFGYASSKNQLTNDKKILYNLKVTILSKV